MLKKIILLLVLLFSSVGFAQKAATDYFPISTGFRWIYQNTPLDSNNLPLNDLTTFQVDSFISDNLFYQNKTAKMLLTKPNYQTPVADSVYWNFDGENAWSYFQPNLLGDFGDSLGITDLLGSHADWYNLYRFNTSVAYTVFSKDTTLTLDSLVLPLRFSVKGKKINDQNLSTAIGNFSCKRFVLTAAISYVVNQYIAIPLVQIPDTVYIAPENWIVRQSRASQQIDLSQLADLTGTAINIPKFYLNGQISQVVDSIPQVGIQIVDKKSDLKVFNYPNPFNNQTVIAYTIPETKLLKLKIYDLAGRLIYSRTISHLTAGKHYEHLNLSSYSGGIYTYTIEADSKKVNGKLVLVK